MNGIIIVKKSSGYTSRDIVNILSKKFNTKKVGHTGTLDPLATGVLVVCFGDALKLVEMLTNHDKENLATVLLGLETDTLDITGNILSQEHPQVTKEQIEKALTSLTGSFEEEVPLYSAIKVNGKKLYEYARNNEPVALPCKPVCIYSLKMVDDLIPGEYPHFEILTHVSKGTYIRSLIRDIGLKLNTKATMKELIRTRQGIFSLKNSYSLEDILSDHYQLITKEEVLSSLPSITYDDEMLQKVKNGCLLDNIIEDKYLVIKNNGGEVIAIYEPYSKDLTKMKPYRMF